MTMGITTLQPVGAILSIETTGQSGTFIYIFRTVHDPCRLATWTPICDPISYKLQHRHPPITKPESHATARTVTRGAVDALDMVSTATNQMSTIAAT